MITIDQLRTLAKEYSTTPNYNGLGMVRLPLHNNAYLFYSEKTPAINHTIHDHRYSFWSTVIKGVLRNIIYEYDVVEHETDYMLTYKDLVKKKEYVGEIIHPNVEIHKTCIFDTIQDEQYFIHNRVLHGVEPMENKVITYMQKDSEWSVTANFLVDKTIPYVGVYSQPKSESECWEIIEYTLNDYD